MGDSRKGDAPDRTAAVVADGPAEGAADAPVAGAANGATGGAMAGDVADGRCGLCLVRLGDGFTALACLTAAAPGIEISTDDPELRALRARRLATILETHPHVCLSCPDRDGCTRDQCEYGIAPNARCCAELGRCELAMVVAFVDPDIRLRRSAVSVAREAQLEGPIRREPGLCIRCGRCVAACDTLPEAGRALELSPRVRPKQGTLPGSGCTFCGACALVCPSGALTSPGEPGRNWLATRRETSSLRSRVLPPEPEAGLDIARLGAVPAEPGVFQLMDAEGHVLRLGGVANLKEGVKAALGDLPAGSVASLRIERSAMYTKRETELLARYAQTHGELPLGGGLGDDAYEDLYDDVCTNETPHRALGDRVDGDDSGGG